MCNIIWISSSGPSQQCSNIVFKVTGDHVVIFAHTRDQRRLTFTGHFDTTSCFMCFVTHSSTSFLFFSFFGSGLCNTVLNLLSTL